MNTPDLDRCGDDEILELSLSDPHRFEVIYERHYPSIHRYVTRRLGRDAADDIASEVFLRAFDSRHRYRSFGHGTCLPWLYRIASHISLNEARRRGREAKAVRRIDARDATTDEVSNIAWRVDARRCVEESGIIDVISGLDEDLRDTLYLHALADASYLEIADATGVPVGTVKSRLSRLRVKLRKQLERLDRCKELV
ncbi:MAG: RNA polymerase sigma factor [Actinomycetota bacterium]